MENKKKFIIIGALVIVLLIIVIVISTKNNSENPDDATNSFSYITENGYDVSGTWYSYHDNNSSRVYKLDLKNDGTFISTWLDNGLYSVEGEKIILTDSFGEKKELELRPDDTKSEVILYFDNQNHSFTYYRTEAELEETKVQTEEELEEMDKLYSAAINQILTTGEWKDNSGETTLIFTENEYSATYKSSISDKEETIVNKYEILEFEAENNTYKMKWETTDIDGFTQTINDIVITIKNDNEYYLTSYSLPFATSYSKIIEIIFEQPCETTPDNVATDDDYRQAEGNNSNPTQSIVNSRIIDNSERDYDTLFKEIETVLIGTWKGTFDDNSSNAVYWEYVFDGSTYSFKNENEEHKGIYSLKHDKDNKYHSTLILNIEGEQSKEYAFYLAGNEVITLNFSDNNFPVFLKQ